MSDFFREILGVDVDRTRPEWNDGFLCHFDVIRIPEQRWRPSLEIGIGKFTGEYHLEGSLFIDEDDFAIADGIVRKHIPRFTIYDTINVPKKIGSRIAYDWKEAARLLPRATDERVLRLLNICDYAAPHIIKEFRHRPEAAVNMLGEMAKYVTDAYQRHRWIRIVGI